MYETVKTVNGYEIYRMIGSRRCYHVTTEILKTGARIEYTFRSIKAASEFCKHQPARL